MSIDNKKFRVHVEIQPLWGIEEVSRHTGYAVGTLYNLTSKNVIPHRRKRGRLFFIPTEIQNWIEEGGMK